MKIEIGAVVTGYNAAYIEQMAKGRSSDKAEPAASKNQLVDFSEAELFEQLLFTAACRATC